MILFILFMVMLALSWWALSTKLQQAFYSEWSPDLREKTPQLLNGVIRQQLRTWSPQNAVAQALVDFELKSKTLRSALLLVCFQRLGLGLIGILVACSLEWPVFLALLVTATLVFIVAFKKPSRWIQISLLCATFFGLYQWSFFRANLVVFSEPYQDLAFFLADGRWFQALGLAAISLGVTVLIRFEFWSVLLASILFFAGALPLPNAMALVIGEAVGWSVFWWYWALRSSKVAETLFREKLILVILTSFFVMSLLLLLRGLGWLDVRIMGPLGTKKVLFLTGWAFWEVCFTFVLSTWGHFRARSKIQDQAELEPIRIPAALLGFGFWGYRGWLREQIESRHSLIQKRVQNIESQILSLDEKERQLLPPGFLDKAHQEVESLKRLLGAVQPDSV